MRGVKACEAPAVPGVSTAVTGREGLRAGGGTPGAPLGHTFPLALAERRNRLGGEGSGEPAGPRQAEAAAGP